MPQPDPKTEALVRSDWWYSNELFIPRPYGEPPPRPNSPPTAVKCEKLFRHAVAQCRDDANEKNQDQRAAIVFDVHAGGEAAARWARWQDLRGWEATHARLRSTYPTHMVSRIPDLSGYQPVLKRRVKSTNYTSTGFITSGLPSVLTQRTAPGRIEGGLGSSFDYPIDFTMSEEVEEGEAAMVLPDLLPDIHESDEETTSSGPPPQFNPIISAEECTTINDVSLQQHPTTTVAPLPGECTDQTNEPPKPSAPPALPLSPDSPTPSSVTSRSFSHLQASLTQPHPSQSTSQARSRKRHILRGMLKALRRQLEASATYGQSGTPQSAIENVKDCERLLALGGTDENLAEIQGQLTLLALMSSGNDKVTKMLEVVLAAVRDEA